MRVSRPFIILFLIASTACAQSYTISTAVGAGPPSNVAAKSTSLAVGYPTYLASDTAGDVFFVDGNAVIEMNATSGVLTIVAGTGATGYSGDGGAATAALLNNPQGLAVDSTGNLYIADAGNNVVREVSNGVIKTIAGNGQTGSGCANGPALSASFNGLTGLAVDSHGSVYLADSSHSCVRKISGANVTTVAGTGVPGYNGDNQAATAAKLSVYVAGVAVDSNGNLYIADTDNSRVREVSNGTITTVAGNGLCCTYGGDGGAATNTELAIDGIAVDSNGNLFISEETAYVIRKVTNGAISTVAGDNALVAGFSGDTGPATSAQLSMPFGVAVDGAGRLYLADQGNNRIREVSGGTIDTVVGNGSIGDNGPASEAQSGLPIGIGLDTSGNLYIADQTLLRVRKVTASTGIVTTVAGNGNTLPVVTNGAPATAVGLDAPSAVAADKNGNIYIANAFACQILEVSSGKIATFAGDGTCAYSGNGVATSAQIGNSFGITTDSHNNVYFSDSVETDTTTAAYVQEVSGGNISLVAGNGNIGLPVSGTTATNSELEFPVGMATDSQDNFYFADVYNNIICKVSGGILTIVAGNGQMTGTPASLGDGGPATAATLNNPGGVAVDAQGNIYIADTDNNRIRMVSASTGNIATIAGTGVLGYSGDYGPATSAELNNPFDVAVNSAGSVFIADSSGRIRVLTPSTNSSCSYSGVPATLPVGAASGNRSVTVTTPFYCPWSVSGLPGWITLTTASSFTGSGTAGLSIAANTGTTSRSATITIAGTSVLVSQPAPGTFSPCDINQDGIVNALDIQLLIKEALGKSSAVNDLNSDGVINVVDVEIDAQAVLYQVCLAY